MAVSQRLDLRQSQSLVMTPQLQQAIRLLQLTNIELAQYVEGELLQNPLLEREEHAEGEGPDRDRRESETLDSRADQDQAAAEEPAGVERLPGDDSAPYDSGESGDDYERSETSEWAGDDAPVWSEQRGMGAGGGEDDDGTPLVQRLGETTSLRDHLLNQAQLELADPQDRIIAVHLIDQLDEAGYLRGDLTELADLLGCPAGRIETTLKKVQGFDPAGLFARDLKECLALQLADLNRLDPAMQALLDNLELLARRDHARLLQLCGVDREDLDDMIAEIRALDPKPALTFDLPPSEPVVPDVLMRALPNGGWQIELNADTLPRVLVNQRYLSRLRANSRTREEREYLTEQFQSANWLVKALHQRANTILKVATEIVRQQDAFFRKGVQHLRPLTLRDVADAIEMHESTVSRVTSNKFIATPRGTYELKYFFTAAIQGTTGQAHSAEAVRDRIRRMIDGEQPEAVLSDDTIVERLRQDGVDIARRTVAKYREAMRIPSSVERRRAKMVRA